MSAFTDSVICIAPDLTIPDLPSELVKISSIMEKLSRKSLIKRVISTDESAELLTKHRRVLQNAVALFQVSLRSTNST